MFYLIFGQAYSRGYLQTVIYNRLCVNKDTKIHMPKMKVDEDTDIKIFSEDELSVPDEYFYVAKIDNFSYNFDEYKKEDS